jgi:hypothetical protein
VLETCLDKPGVGLDSEITLLIQVRYEVPPHSKSPTPEVENSVRRNQAILLQQS